MSTIEKALKRKKEETNRDAPPRTGARAPADQPQPQVAAGPSDNETRTAASGSDRPDPLAGRFEPRGPLLRIETAYLRRLSMYPPVRMEDRLSNEYRRIKRPILANATGRGAIAVERGNIVMITSAIQGEGKTFTALNLGLSIARDPDYTITLVDGDVARGHLSRVLGVDQQPGLLDLLADDTLDPSDLAMTTNVETLSVLPAGTGHALSEELLSSERMSRILEYMGAMTQRHIVLFDSPPVLAAPDAVTLSRHVGQIAVVVKASSTLRQQVTTAVDQLDPSKAINMILNQSLGGPGGDAYGGYYGYPAYGSGGNE